MKTARCSECTHNYSVSVHLPNGKCPVCESKPTEAPATTEEVTQEVWIIKLAIGMTLGVLVAIGLILADKSGGSSSNSLESAKPTASQEAALMKVIRTYGYTCDWVDAAVPFALSEGWHAKCNGYRYSYEIANKGGRARVTVN